MPFNSDVQGVQTFQLRMECIRHLLLRVQLVQGGRRDVKVNGYDCCGRSRHSFIGYCMLAPPAWQASKTQSWGCTAAWRIQARIGRTRQVVQVMQLVHVPAAVDSHVPWRRFVRD